MWKDIRGYEGFYQVSPGGYIRTIPRIRPDNKQMVKE